MDIRTDAPPPSDNTQRPGTPDPARSDAPQLRTLLLTDLCDSTMLVERLGDGPAADLFRAHDRIVLRLQEQWRGRLIDRSDGLLLLFERPIDGLGFALDYARALRDLGVARNIDLKARAGLHVGEVLTWHNSDAAVRVGAKPLEVEGLAKPMAGRLMTMARPGQILLSAIAEPLAHRAARELGQRGDLLLWKSHGRWCFRGVPQAQEIFEVGEAGITPLRAPLTSNKAWRDIPLWRRPGALAAQVVLLAAIGIGGWFLFKPQPAIAFGERDWVVVGDLRNLTGQPVLDESLEQAFRISLEQSRYVNVLSDMKARDTLARMRKPADTRLDRTIASEIAVRDGARAVILPMVSEVGGEVRVSAEIIDPATHATVHVASADGIGMASVLASVDAVTEQLRATMGESVQAIGTRSTPLAQVTTSSLDALRAYSLGVDALARRQRTQARQLFERAYELDPQFALACVGVMRSYVGEGDHENASIWLDRARALRARLAPREQMYLDAWWIESSSLKPLEVEQHWRNLLAMYPTAYAGAYNGGFVAFSEGRYADAVRLAKAADAPQNPLRAASRSLVGRILLASGDASGSIRALEEADALMGRTHRETAAAHAAAGQMDTARERLGLVGNPPAGLARIEEMSIAIADGRLRDAARVGEAAQSGPDASPALVRTVVSISGLTASWLATPRSPPTRQLQKEFARSAQDAGNAQGGARLDHASGAIALAILGERMGDPVNAKQLAQLKRAIATSASLNLSDLLTTLEARSRMRRKDYAGAIEILAPLVRRDNALFQARVAWAEAHHASGNRDVALDADRWLVAHPGLAWGQLGPSGGLQTLNVADARRAAQRLAGARG